jgi:hypothetical protein
VGATPPASAAATAPGQLYTFGLNEFGRLGNTRSILTGASNPAPELVTLPGENGPVTQTAAGYAHSLVVTSTGQLYAFGENLYGQLGRATNSSTNTPNPTPTLVDLPSGSGTVVEVAAGYTFALVLTSSGQLYAFGENQYGQLGSTVDNGSSVANPTPELVGLPGADGPVTQIAARFLDSLALTSTGQLFAFGNNQLGQLGSNVNNDTYAANPTPKSASLPGSVGSVVRVAAGITSTFAITRSGQLYSFGENRYGQLGNMNNSGVAEVANPIPGLSEFPGGTTIGSVGTGSSSYHALAVVSDLAVTTAALPARRLGVPYGATAQASGGTAPYRWTAGGLPAGLGIDSATGQTTGTPTARPTSAVTLSVTDAEGTTASATIPPAGADSSPALPGPGTSSAAHCRVPKLKGKKLKAAKKRIKVADCKVGKVTTKSTTGKAARVVEQKPKAGTTRPPGSKITVVLGGK